MSIRTPLARARGLGSAKAGTEHFWLQRVTSVASVPLSLAFVVIVIALLGRNHAFTVQMLGSPPVAIIMILFVLTVVYHMWLGMQVIIEDYVRDELLKLLSLMGNTFFSVVVALACLFAILKLSFGV